MKRNTIQCKKCGEQDFEVNVNYCIPRAIQLECKYCGYITSIAFFDIIGRAYAINGTATYEAYQDSYCGDVTEKEAMEAERCDMQNK